MRRTICKIMGAVMIMSLIWSAPSVTASDRSESQNITSVRTPINDKKGGTVWTRSFSVDGTLTYNSTPVITDDAIYLVSGNTLYELDLDGNIKRQMALAATMNSVCYMSRQENTLWIPLSGGTMQCVDINTMQSLWVSEAFGGQSLSYVTVYNGYVYAGTAEVSINSTQGTFYCLDARTGKLQWKYRNEEQPGGYYWGGSVVMDDKLYFCIDFLHVKPGKGNTFMRTKLKDVVNGYVLERRFNIGEKLEDVRVERRPHQYLYHDGDNYQFMNQETFDQIPIAHDLINGVDFLLEGMIVDVVSDASTETVLYADVPIKVQQKITYTEPGLKGDTATNTLKPATVESGATVRVPLFINEGETIEIDTRDGSYVSRVKA